MPIEEDVLLACACFVIINYVSNLPRKRRWWTRRVLEEGTYYGRNLLSDLRFEDGAGFRNFTRMTPTDFEFLLNSVGPRISRTDTNYRASISSTIRLAVTLRFLASGDSYTSLHYTFKISKQIISRIVPEVCEAIIASLRRFVKIPSTFEDWSTIASGFDKRWNFPNCIGAMDGKHINIVSPANSGSMFYNYKGTFSIVLLAVVDFDYNFIYADIGCQGRISDGGVFRSTSFFEKLENSNLNLPRPRPLANGRTPVPYVLVADDAFALSDNLMKPYPGHLGSVTPERIYNYRVSRARRIVENVFGIMAAKFRIFLTTIALHPDKVETVTLACVYLHNFLRRDSISRKKYTPPGSFDTEDIEGRTIVPGSWRAEVNEAMLGLQVLPRKPMKSASKIREEFRDFFNSDEGQVPWQKDFA